MVAEPVDLGVLHQLFLSDPMGKSSNYAKEFKASILKP